MNLDEYGKKILEPSVNKFAAKQAMNMMYGSTPLTRRQKFKWWLVDWKYRLSSCWKILRGKNIYEDCG